MVNSTREQAEILLEAGLPTDRAPADSYEPAGAACDVRRGQAHSEMFSVNTGGPHPLLLHDLLPSTSASSAAAPSTYRSTVPGQVQYGASRRVVLGGSRRGWCSSRRLQRIEDAGERRLAVQPVSRNLCNRYEHQADPVQCIRGTASGTSLNFRSVPCTSNPWPTAAGCWTRSCRSPARRSPPPPQVHLDQEDPRTSDGVSISIDANIKFHHARAAAAPEPVAPRH